jgi:hypothetical protein
VPLRRNVGLNESPASFEMSRSARTLDSPYGVTGLNSAFSSTMSAAAP